MVGSVPVVVSSGTGSPNWQTTQHNTKHYVLSRRIRAKCGQEIAARVRINARLHVTQQDIKKRTTCHAVVAPMTPSSSQIPRRRLCPLGYVYTLSHPVNTPSRHCPLSIAPQGRYSTPCSQWRSLRAHSKPTRVVEWRQCVQQGALATQATPRVLRMLHGRKPNDQTIRRERHGRVECMSGSLRHPAARKDWCPCTGLGQLWPS
jgi:hypothetical protein